MRSFSHNRQYATIRGFTLVELLISLAIIIVITSIVLVKYSAFDSTTILKGAAYEIALALRDSQVKSISVVRSDKNLDSSFNYPYGMTFTTALSDQKKYVSFRYKDLATSPQYDVPDTQTPFAEDLGTGVLERSMYIKDTCVVTNENNNPEYCSGAGITRLDISFRRPEFAAIFNAHGFNVVPQSRIISAKIKVGSTAGPGIFIVEVSKLGQITVKSGT